MKKFVDACKGNNDQKVREKKFHLQNEFTLSLIFVLNAVVSSSLAIHAALNTEKQANSEVAK